MLSQVSPDGRYVVSTVKDRSVFVDRPDLAFSQLFFPVKGILAVYGRTTRTFSPLAGADDPAYVQTNPAWSPDGQWLVFARSKAHRLPDARNPNAILLTQQECREFLREGKTFSFDLYRLPFNGGRGGKPEPLKGASFNGKSNFFPKFSPDGRWIVFCQARSFMLLQPDSELYIVPAEGGDARRLDGNTPRMNSWHSWSPNGRWLVFSSKANGPYTQLWLTQMDPGGNSAPPVLLDRLTEAGRAANIPEFVPAGEAAIAVIRERYLDAVSYVRAGNELRLAGDLGAAEKKYRLALALAPDNVDALVFLGFVLMARSAFDEATASLLKAIGLDPSNAEACFHLAVVRARQGRTADAERFFAASLRARPDYAVAHAGLGLALEQAGRADEAIRHYRNALRCDPAMATVHCDLGRLLAARGLLEESASHLLEACRLEPDAPQAVAVLRQVARQAAASGRGDLARKIEDRLLGGP
jgi:tetratricopeptide (TPR) repeat protein